MAGDYENVVGLPLATLLDIYPELLAGLTGPSRARLDVRGAQPRLAARVLFACKAAGNGSAATYVR